LSLPATAPAGAVGAHGVARAVLDNGLTVLVQEDRSSPLVTVATMYQVGARNESAGVTGLAHYVEHMAFRAARGFPGSEVTEGITRIGGRWSGYTWIDQTYYGETVPREAFERMLELEAARMTGALFDPEEFQQERSSVIAELRSYDDPQSLLYDAVLAASFQLHPYRNNTIGFLSDVESLTRDDAYGFYRRYYHPGNAVLVVVGDVGAADALDKIRARLGAVPAGGESGAVRAVEPPQDGERRVVVRKPGGHARALLAFRAPALSEPDFPALVLLDALLAGGKGAYFTRDYPEPPETPLRRATVGAGLASEAGTRWQASPYPYVYTLSAAAPSERELPSLEAALLGVLEDARGRDWTDAELRAALRQIRTGWALDLDDQASRAHQLAFFEACGGYARLFELPDEVARVSREDLRRFASERLRPSQATIGWFVPTPEGSLFAGAPQPVASVPPPASEPPGPAPSAPTPAPASPSSLSLSNGLRVVLAPRAGSRLAVLRGRVEAGSRFEGRGQAGLSALAVEWLATARPLEPTGLPSLEWTLHEDPESADNVGFIEFRAAGLPEDLGPLLELLAGRLAREAPAAGSWETLRQAVLERCRQRAGSDDGALEQALRRMLFPLDGPLAWPAWGDEQALGAIPASALGAFLRAFVTPARTTLVVAGGFDPGAARQALAGTLAPWSVPGGPAPRPAAVSAPRAPEGWTERFLPRPGKAQNEIRVAVPGDRSRPWDRAATAVILYLLGETGYAGRLGAALVGPGLVYSVYATLEESGAPGFLAIRTAASPQDTPEVLRRIRAELRRAGEGGFSQAELEEARAYLRGKQARRREGTRALAADLLAARAAPAAAEVEALRLARLNDTARRLFRNGGPLALVAGPEPTAR
jgi:zinc protease